MPTIDVADESVEDLLATLAGGATAIVIANYLSLPDRPYATVEAFCAAIASPTLKSLVVDTAEQPLTRQASVFCGDVTDALERCPGLEFAYLIGSAELRRGDHASLRDLTMMADPMSERTITAIVQGHKPQLTRLAIGFSYEHGTSPEADAAFLAALANHGLPALTELHLAYANNSVAVFEALVTSPLFAQLEVLSLVGDFFADEERGLAALRSASLANLRELYLPLEDVMDLSDDELAKHFPAIRGTDDLDVFSPSRYGGG